MAKVICDGCPILHYETVAEGYDAICGLGYQIKHNFQGLSYFAADDRGYESDNCKLEFIRFADDEFRPTIRKE